jgi:hypothetical protein
MLKEPRVGVGTAPVGSALRDAMDDGNARLASGTGEFGNGLDHSVPRAVREGRKSGEISDYTPLAFEYDERALFWRKQRFDPFSQTHPSTFPMLEGALFIPVSSE